MTNTSTEEVQKLRSALQYAEKGWKDALSLVQHYQQQLKKLDNKTPNEITEQDIQITGLNYEIEKLSRQLALSNKKNDESISLLSKHVDDMQDSTSSILSNAYNFQ